MSAFQFAGLGFPAYIPSSAGSIYSNPSSTTTLIKGLLIFNGNTSTETVALYIVPNSGGSVGTAGAGNQVAHLSIASNETVFFPFNVDGQPLILTGHNDSIQAVTTTASKVTATLLGDTYS